MKYGLYKGKPLEGYTRSHYGYMHISIYKNGKRKSEKVHRLLAQSFIPNPENKPQVNHIDGDKSNNKLSNIEWCTAKENIQHAFRIGLRKAPYKGKFGSEHNNSKKIGKYSKDGIFLKSYGGLMEASRMEGTKHQGISLVALGRMKTSGGFIWKYI